METLGQKRQRFTGYVGRLIDEILRVDWYCTLQECARSDEQAEINAIGESGRERVAELIMMEFPDLAKKILNNGKANGVRLSVHQLGLAVDINLFTVTGVYCPDTASHKQFGEFWKKLAPDCRWGGDWGDGNHYSIEHGGVK